MSREELRPPRLARRILLGAPRRGNRDSVIGDIEEEFQEIAREKGDREALRWYRRQALHSLGPFLIASLGWNLSLARSYSRIAMRNLLKNPGYSLINILGLAAGIACCIFIYLFVDFESNYDSYHPDSDRIYRVSKIRKTPAKEDRVSMSTREIVPTLVEEYPEVEEGLIVNRSQYRYVTVEGRRYMHDTVLQGQQNFFDFFGIPLLEGDSGTALERPGTAVLTLSLARKYFGDSDPIGRTVAIDTLAYEVTGVTADCPKDTHLRYDMIVRYQYVPMEHHRPWNTQVRNYIKLAEGVDPTAFEDKIRNIVMERSGEEFTSRGVELTIFLQPIESIHLDSDLMWELDPPGNRAYLLIFSAVGVFILLISSMNFMNLTTARSAGRALEVGVRRVSGAGRGQLAWQFFGESMMISLMAVVTAVAVASLALPWFNRIFSFSFEQADLVSPRALSLYLALALLTGLAGGAYSALVLSSFRPAAVLKGTARQGARGAFMRKALVIGQFSVSIALVAATLIFNGQLQFMKDMYPGWDRDQKLVIEFNRNIIDPASSDAVKAAFLDHPGVKGGTLSSSVPGRWNYKWNLFPYGEEATRGQIVNSFVCDRDFFDVFRIRFIGGGSFEGPGGDRGAVINRAAMEVFGWKTPEEAMQNHINDLVHPIVGVVENFYFRGMQEPVEPLVLFSVSEDFRYLTLDVDIAGIDEIKAHIASTHAALFPDELYESFFLDEDFDTQYATEEGRARLFVFFAVLGIFIACLGLLGLSAFLAQQRTREVGIRKVFGATRGDIVVMMSRGFLKWVLVSNLLAWPIAWLAMRWFLRDFANRIEIGPVPFVLAGASALAVAALTVSYQAFRAGTVDPAVSLKYE